ncbi:uncharacterized protein LOC126893890 [Daktulosphaira vitifoliae]|uniref:uncharacterized protein LOC126893890 n=1 Tax=Daktulosphaira vitifoliae TaxID=58002 RepID=UPI0021AA9C79|nr:uncharacterized protein LOC126893890 [Daktulosphaira vitifoliae]
MVRVITAYNFEGQKVDTCTDPVAFTSAPFNRLLIALPYNAIEVKDFSDNPSPSYTIPTVDQALELAYCTAGNYIITLETKPKRTGQDGQYIRVYCNWEQCCLGTPALRARIAGRVTPTGTQIKDNALDMIELPLMQPKINTFKCCQETGNIAVAYGTTLNIFRMVIKTHDVSRLKFLDFDIWTMAVDLSFNVCDVQIEQDILAVVGDRRVQIFRIQKASVKLKNWKSASTNFIHSISQENEHSNKQNSGPIDLNHLIKFKDDSYLQHCLNPKCFPIMTLTPTFGESALVIQEENAPFNIVNLPITIIETEASEPWADPTSWTIEVILQLELDVSRCHSTDEHIKKLLLQLIYEQHEKSDTSDWSYSRFRSSSYNKLKCVNCLISLNEEAFVYHSIVEHDQSEIKIAPLKCITVYNFTSPVINICMDSCVLHVLTTSSLETYTIRLFPSSSPDQSFILSERVTLIGHKPFLGIVDMVLLENNLVIFTSANLNNEKKMNNSWTMYTLMLPSPNSICKSLTFKAKIAKFKTPKKYIHLMKEALNLTDIVQHYTYYGCGSAQMDSKNFKKFCCLVADYYFLFEKSGWDFSYKLYENAELLPIDVFVRMKQVEDLYGRMKKPVNTKPPIKYYINRWTRDHGDLIDLKTLVYGIKMAEKSSDLLFIADLVLSLEAVRKLPLGLVIKHLKRNLELSYESRGALNFTLLYIYSISSFDTKNIIEPYNEADEMSNKSFVHFCVTYANLLFEQDLSFSDFCLVLMQETPILIAEGLSEIVSSSQSIKLRKVIQAFQMYIGSHIYNMNVTEVFKRFLELHFSSAYNVEKKPELNKKYVCDAIKILFRQYLSDLTKPTAENDKNIDNKNWKNLFHSQIPGYIQMLPYHSNNNENLTKLQSLFYTNWLSKDFVDDIKQVFPMLNKPPLCLEIMTAPNVIKTIEIFIEKCPQAVLKYSIDCIKTVFDWKYVIDSLEKKSKSEIENQTMYHDILHDVLEYLSHNMSVEDFCNILPISTNENAISDDEYKLYVIRCQKINQANQIKSMVMATGQQLLGSLHLK